MTDLFILAACTAAVFVLASAAQAVAGFGSALVAVPLLSLLVGPVPAVVATTAISLAMTRWRYDASVTTSIGLPSPGCHGPASSDFLSGSPRSCSSGTTCSRCWSRQCS